MLIDDFLPDYQISTKHEIIVSSSVQNAYKAAYSLDMSKSAIIRTLFLLRGLPQSSLTIEGLQKTGFTMLGENPNREFLLGITGQFWKLKGELQFLDPEAFKKFNSPDFAKAAWNFQIESNEKGKIKVKTETRIQFLDDKSYSRFRIYWFFIRPFSSWIRKKSLKIIKTEAESH